MIRIHPAIGIARIGNSGMDVKRVTQEHYFVGPEIPNRYDLPRGGYRDREYRLKRQAARFRLYAFDRADRLLGEITQDDAIIEWSAHLVNSKAVGRKFNGVLHPDEHFRNRHWLSAGYPRDGFILNPGPKTVSLDAPVARCTCDAFMGVRFDPTLELGRLIYERRSGTLLVLGGHGRSGSPVGASLKETNLNDNDFANHQGWFDDVSDGPVTARVLLKTGPVLEAKPAWVVVAPPKYAPALQSIVTLYDTLYQVAIDRALAPSPFADPEFRPSFREDIQPILRRALALRWVFASASVSHDMADGPGKPSERQHLLRQFRVPSGHPLQPGTGTGRMPYMWSDLYVDAPVSATLTRTQYRMMEAWAAGAFLDDSNASPQPAHPITPEGLDRAALEACVGAAFFPGIEVSWKMRDQFGYTEPFRLDPATLAPGDITQQMSLPWMTDFLDCAYEDPYVWWPAQRPIDVKRHAGSVFRPWARPFRSGAGDMNPREMVRDFYRLGHVLKSGVGFFETGRVTRAPKQPFNERNFARVRRGTRRVRKK
jgi:hypothetical protein